MKNLRRKKVIKKVTGFISLAFLLAVIAFGIFIANFNLFGAVKKTELKSACDAQGLRKIIMTKVDGNPTANPSIHVVATPFKTLNEKQELEPIL